MDYATKDKLRVASDRLCDRLSVLAPGDTLLCVVRHALAGAIESSDDRAEVVQELALISAWVFAQGCKRAFGEPGQREQQATAVVSQFNEALQGDSDA